MWNVISRRNPLLAWGAFAHLVFFALSLAGYLLDSRLVTGINPWIKPMKFDLSIVIYLVTMAWVLEYLPGELRRGLSRGILFSMLVETFCIALQAARGVGSHFNVATIPDNVIFGVMGLAILYNTYLIARATLAFFRPGRAELPASYLWGIRWGLISLFIGSVLGGCLIAHMGHSVGVADGGPGLPFLNWSTRGGDLRVAHFIGLHAIQPFILLGAWLSRGRVPARTALRWLAIVFFVFIALDLSALAWAVMGNPIVRI